MKIADFKIKKPRIYTKEQELADRIFFYFKKKLKFPMIMRFIKIKGYEAVHQIWDEVKHSRAKNKPALFLWKVKNEQIIFGKSNGKRNPKNSHG